MMTNPPPNQRNTQGGLAGFALTLLIFAIIIPVLYQYEWSGFRDKTLWDWFELAIIPLVAIIAGYFLQRIERRRDERNKARDDHQADEERLENILRGYLDDISRLMINHKLQYMLELVEEERLRRPKLRGSIEKNTVEEPSEHSKSRMVRARAIVTVARARTVTAFNALNAERIAILTNFFREADLAMGSKGTLLVDIGLTDVNLQGTKFTKFNMQYADFDRSQMQYAIFESCDLRNAMFESANLEGIRFKKIAAQNIDFRAANLKNAVFIQCNFAGANFAQANLDGAIFQNCTIDEQTVLPESTLDSEGTVEEKLFCTPETDLNTYTNNSKFYQPDYLKSSKYEGYTPKWAQPVPSLISVMRGNT